MRREICFRKSTWSFLKIKNLDQNAKLLGVKSSLDAEEQTALTLRMIHPEAQRAVRRLLKASMNCEPVIIALIYVPESQNWGGTV